jgi:hypothetical protein
MNVFTVGQVTKLTLMLDDGATGLFPQALVYRNGTLDATVNLSHLANGRYSGDWTPAQVVDHDVVFIVYSDAGHTTLATAYTREMERWQVDWARLAQKILRNRLELADGSTNNWVLYDDDNTTVLLTFSVADKVGGIITQPTASPSRRTRGV